MHTHQQEIALLLYRFCAGEVLSQKEQIRLDEWLDAAPENRETLDTLQRDSWLQPSLLQYARMEEEKETDWEIFARKIEPATTVHVRRINRTWMKYAAAFLLLLAVGSWLWLRQSNNNRKQKNTTIAATAIKPGQEGAVLTLADGSRINLDSLGNGWQTQQSGTTLKLENGKLAYNSRAGATESYNTIATPNGRQFHVQLPDGSHVWLNAASSLTYPTVFSGNRRQVSVTGEVYFEVKSDAKQPFLVQTDDQSTVEVLGTGFNLNAYANESVTKTTLVEGSILVKTGTEQALLKPGQQAVYNTATHNNIHIRDADTEQELAWKNGFFNFNNEDIPAFLRQLERWYDIDVIIDGAIPSMKFKGGLDRSNSLQEILKVLSKLNIPYKLEGRVLSVGTK